MNSPATFISKENIATKLAEINATFNVNILPTELLVNDYSVSSATDFLAARVEEELNGEWSTAIILQKISVALNNQENWPEETSLHQIFPDKNNRRKHLKEIGKKIGYPIEKLLRPSKSLYGTCLVLLFLCIPAAIGLSWFFSSLLALLLIFTLYYLDRNGSNFRSKTLIEFAEEIEWKRNMELRKLGNRHNTEDIKPRIHKILNP